MTDELNLEQAVLLAVVAASKTRKDHQFQRWAEAWISGKDRSSTSAQEIKGGRTVGTFAASAADIYDRYLIETKEDFKRAHGKALRMQVKNALEIFARDYSESALEQIKNQVLGSHKPEIYGLAENLKAGLLRFRGGLSELERSGSTSATPEAREAAQNLLAVLEENFLSKGSF
jgi:hypothetical protein